MRSEEKKKIYIYIYIYIYNYLISGCGKKFEMPITS